MKNNKKNNPLFLFSFLLLTYLFLIPLVLKFIVENNYFSTKSSAELGDTIGGITNPFIGSAAVIVTFAAFYIQYAFNLKQNKIIKKQRQEYAKDKFDRKFSELLKIQVENVREFNIDNRIYGRKTFVHMLNELKIIHKVVNFYCGIPDQNFITNIFNREDFAYMIFFNGLDVETNYDFLYQNLNDVEKQILKNVFHKLFEIQLNYIKNKKDILVYKDDVIGFIEFSYYPFDGHSHRLGHYYRNLHNFIEIIDKEKIISYHEKKQYVDLIRAQLSDYEQALLYCNSTSWFFDQWERFFEEYTLIKNLRRDFVSFTISPEIIFKEHIERMKFKNIKMFEWVNLDKL